MKMKIGVPQGHGFELEEAAVEYIRFDRVIAKP
jgi:hypothetical protein